MTARRFSRSTPPARLRAAFALLVFGAGLLGGCGAEDQITIALIRAGDGDPLGAASTVEVSVLSDDPAAAPLATTTFAVGESGKLGGKIPYGATVHVVARGLTAGGDVVALGGSRELTSPLDKGSSLDVQLLIAATNSFYGTFDASSGSSTGPDSGLPGLSVTRLSDGQVLVAGGTEVDALGQITGISATAYLYDPDRGAYRKLSSGLNNPRAYHTATALRGRPSSILLCGGLTIVNNQIVSAATCEVFDPSNEGFSPVPMPLNLPRVGHAAVLLPDGRVLLTGGADVAKVSLPCSSCGRDELLLSAVHKKAEVYDPTARSLTLVQREMIAKRAFHTALRANKNGRVLLVGGEDDAGTTLASTESFTPEGDLFSACEDLDVARTRHAAARLPNDDVCVFGGLSDSATLTSVVGTFECYTVDAFGGAQKTAQLPMFASRRDHCAVPLSTGEVLLFGGYGPDGNALATAELDGPGITAAQAGVPLKARALHACTGLGGGAGGWEAVLVVGGVDVRDGLWTSQPSGEIYTP
jgi:hypothetical protein